jgi:hypothetical protein
MKTGAARVPSAGLIRQGAVNWAVLPDDSGVPRCRFLGIPVLPTARQRGEAPGNLP